MNNHTLWFTDHLDSGKIRFKIRNQETKVQIADYDIEIDDVINHIKKLYPKMRIRKVDLSVFYLKTKMTRKKMQITKDYLEFMFN